ncbi:MAG: molybdopterin-dependent oxidoreductase [Firmicutes bacterium]|nr:molybdopterin-dependent oxidoreductase [Bacillota bacterium]
MATEIKHGLCGMCRSQCAITATVTDGVIRELAADTASPRGRLCARGALAKSVIYGKDRLLHPLIRTGDKGEGKFRAAGWDEALDHAAQGFRHILEDGGPRALAAYFGQGVLEDTITMAGDRFWDALHSPNGMNCGSICNTVSRHIAPITTLGISGSSFSADLEHCRAVFVWGKNTDTDEGTKFYSRRIQKAQQRGAKLVVIDPRQTGIGEKADLWVPVLPGSDGALALAMLKYTVENRAYDQKIVADHTKDFDKLAAYLRGLDTADLLRRCRIPEQMFRQLMDIFLSSEKIPLISYTGLEYQLSGVQSIRAIFLLWAITGKVDVEGGLYIDEQAIETWRPYAVDPAGPPLGAEDFPVFAAFTGKGQFSRFPQAVLEQKPYGVQGLLLCGGSPLLSYPDSRCWREAYGKLRYMIVLERYMTEDAKYADVIFPAATWYENASAYFFKGQCQLRYPLIEPLGEAKNDVFILQNLAERLGFGDALPKNDRELHLWALGGDASLLEKLNAAGGPVYLRQPPPRQYRKYENGLLRKDGKPGFPTESGKIEPYAALFEKYGYDPLPEYRDIRDLPGMDEQYYPLLLTSGSRGKVRIGTFGQNIPEMAAYDPYPVVEISAADAAQYQVCDGETVCVISPFGRKSFTARIAPMAKGAIHIPFGGGSSFMNAAWANGNVNDLCSLDYTDPISGFVTIKSVPCRMEKL